MYACIGSFIVNVTLIVLSIFWCYFQGTSVLFQPASEFVPMIDKVSVQQIQNSHVVWAKN